MIILVGTVVVWTVTFLVFFFPGRYVGSSIAKGMSRGWVGHLTGGFLCLKFAFVGVTILQTAMLFAQFKTTMPNFYKDPLGFGTALFIFLFFLPILSTIAFGYIRQLRSSPPPAPMPPRRVERFVR